MVKKGEYLVGDGGVMVEQFWKDNGNRVLAITAAIGAGAAALLLVKGFFDAKKRKKIEAEVASVNLNQFVEGAMELGEDHGGEEVAGVAEKLAGEVEHPELADALSAVSMIAGESKRRKG